MWMLKALGGAALVVLAFYAGARWLYELQRGGRS